MEDQAKTENGEGFVWARTEARSGILISEDHHGVGCWANEQRDLCAREMGCVFLRILVSEDFDF